jgi:hypothetical protein
MQVIEAQRAPILEAHDHLHISHERTWIYIPIAPLKTWR